MLHTHHTPSAAPSTAQDYGVLQVAVVESCNAAGLQPVPAFVTKVRSAPGNYVQCLGVHM